MTTTGDTRSPRRRARRGEGDRLREDILAAAEKLLLETGDEDAVSIRAVADAVGVTPPSIYMHFADKNALMFAICQRQFRVLDGWMATTIEGIDTPLDRLRAMGRAYVAFGREHPETYRVLFMHHPHDAPESTAMLELLGESGFQRLLQDVQNCIDAGIFAGDVQIVAVQIWAAVHGITSLLISKPEFPWPDLDVLFDSMTETMFRGLAPGATPS